MYYFDFRAIQNFESNIYDGHPVHKEYEKIVLRATLYKATKGNATDRNANELSDEPEDADFDLPLDDEDIQRARNSPWLEEECERDRTEHVPQEDTEKFPVCYICKGFMDEWSVAMPCGHQVSLL